MGTHEVKPDPLQLKTERSLCLELKCLGLTGSHEILLVLKQEDELNDTSGEVCKGIPSRLWSMCSVHIPSMTSQVLNNWHVCGTSIFDNELKMETSAG